MSSFDSISIYHNQADRYTVHNTLHFQAVQKKQSNQIGDSLEGFHQEQPRARASILNISVAQVTKGAVAGIGKAVFLVTVLPVYLVVYGIPKWVIIVGIPKMLSLLKASLIRTVRIVIAQLVGIVNAPFTALFRKVKDLVHYTLSVVNVIKGIFERIMQKVQAIKDNTVSLFKYIASYPKNFLAIMGELIVRPFKFVKQFMETTRNRMSTMKDQVGAYFQRLVAMVRMPKIHFKPIENPFKGFSKVIEKVSEKVSEFTNMIGDKAAQIAQFARSVYQPVISFISSKAEAVKEKVSEVTSLVQRKIEAVASYVGAKAQAAAETVMEAQERFFIAFLQTPFQQVGDKGTFVLKAIINNIQVIFEKLQAIPRTVVSHAKRLVKKIGELKDKGYNAFKRGAKWTFEKIKRAPKKALTLIKKGVQKVGRILDTFFKYVEIFFARLAILMRFWMECVKEAASAFLKI